MTIISISIQLYMWSQTMNRPSESYGGTSNWGLFITVPICLILIAYFLTSGLKPSDKQAAVENLKTAWYTPKTARGDDLANKSMVGNCFLCHAYWVGIPDPTVVRPRFAHANIELNHGTNDRCFNCHLIHDRWTGWYMAMPSISVAVLGVENASMPV